MRRPAGARGVHDHRPSGLLELENMAERHSSWRQRQAPSGISQRVHIPVQPPLLPVQCVPLAARPCRKRYRPNQDRIIFGTVATPCMLWLSAFSGQAWDEDPDASAIRNMWAL